MEELKEKEYYREKLLDMLNSIEKTDILNYLYVIVCDIMEEEREGV